MARKGAGSTPTREVEQSTPYLMYSQFIFLVLDATLHGQLRTLEVSAVEFWASGVGVAR